MQVKNINIRIMGNQSKRRGYNFFARMKTNYVQNKSLMSTPIKAETSDLCKALGFLLTLEPKADYQQ